MQGRNKFISIGSFKAFTAMDKDDKNAPLLAKYMSNVKDEITEQLKIDKNMTEEDAREMCDNMFSSRIYKSKEIRDSIKNNYIKEMSMEDCAADIIKNYFKYANFNRQDTEKHEDITEISESKILYHYKTVSNSLFWNFIRILNDLDIRFDFDLSMINGKDNSLNHNTFLFYIDTQKIDKRLVIPDLSNSKIFSKTVEYITLEEDENIKFYIGISDINKLRFGYIINGNRYTIGDIDYTSSDMKKLADYIDGKNDDILFKSLGVKFKSSLYIMQTLKFQLNRYLGNYMDTKVYLTVIENKLMVVVETEDEDIISYKYIYNILKENNFFKLKDDSFIITELLSKNKTHYHIVLK